MDKTTKANICIVIRRTKEFYGISKGFMNHINILGKLTNFLRFYKIDYFFPWLFIKIYLNLRNCHLNFQSFQLKDLTEWQIYLVIDLSLRSQILFLIWWSAFWKTKYYWYTHHLPSSLFYTSFSSILSLFVPIEIGASSDVSTQFFLSLFMSTPFKYFNAYTWKQFFSFIVSRNWFY